MDKQTDAYIMEKLGSEDKADRQEAMLYLYQTMYDKVGYYIQKNSGTLMDTDDIFQDSLVELYKKARTGRLGDHIRLEAYFFTICKNHWLKELQKKKRTVALTHHHENVSEEETQESILLTKERNALVDQLISRFGTTCYQVLRYYYYDKRRMKEIANLLSLSNEQAAKDKKNSCMKKLRKLIKENSHYLELLK